MSSIDERVADALERLFPSFDGEPGDWENVLRRAVLSSPRPSEHRRSCRASPRAQTGALSADALGWGTRPLGACGDVRTARPSPALGWGTRPL